MLAVPALTPVTVPVPLPMLTWPDVVLHTPPPAPSVNVICAPTHTAPAPDMAVGPVFTVSVTLVMQPAGVV